MECSRARANGAGTWVDSGALNRVDLWLYPSTPTGAEAFVIYNGQGIRSGPLAHDLTGVENPGINPRQFGCSELVSTVQSVLGLPAPVATTVGSDAEPLLSGLGPQGLQTDAYRIGVSRTLVVTSLGGQSVIGMVTL
jgi:hypothetical protein